MAGRRRSGPRAQRAPQSIKTAVNVQAIGRNGGNDKLGGDDFGRQVPKKPSSDIRFHLLEMTTKRHGTRQLDTWDPHPYNPTEVIPEPLRKAHAPRRSPETKTAPPI